MSNAARRLPPPPSAPLATLAEGDCVVVHVHRPRLDEPHTWDGQVVAVDRVALRLRANGYRIACSWCDCGGREVVVPWRRVARVVLEFC